MAEGFWYKVSCLRNTCIIIGLVIISGVWDTHSLSVKSNKADTGSGIVSKAGQDMFDTSTFDLNPTDNFGKGLLDIYMDDGSYLRGLIEKRLTRSAKAEESSEEEEDEMEQEGNPKLDKDDGKNKDRQDKAEDKKSTPKPLNNSSMSIVTTLVPLTSTTDRSTTSFTNSTARNISEMQQKAQAPSEPPPLKPPPVAVTEGGPFPQGPGKPPILNGPPPKYAIINGTRVKLGPPPRINGSFPPGMFPPKGALGGKPPFQIPPHFFLQQSGGGPPKPPPKKGEIYLPEGYNKLEIPKLDAGKLFGIKLDKLSAVPVLVFLNLRAVQDVDEEEEEIVLDMDMRVEWVDGILFDPRAAIAGGSSKQITLNPIFLDKIWKPDVYIDELVKVRKPFVMDKPHTLLFNPVTGLVSYTFRMRARLTCEMDFVYYPADTQSCQFHLRSYSFFNFDLSLSWLRNGVFLQDPGDPNFDLQVESIETIMIKQIFNEANNNSYDGLKFTISARRKLSYHMVQSYLPSIFFIIITWLCFLVPANMVEARIGISMTTLLTLTAMFSSVRDQAPRVSYVKAIDIWMVFCVFFVFLTLLEFSLLVWIRSRREAAMDRKLETSKQLRRGKGKRGSEGSPTLSMDSIALQKYEMFAEFTEKWAFLIFSIIFVIFNIMYWTWLLQSSDYFNWDVNATHNNMIDD